MRFGLAAALLCPVLIGLAGCGGASSQTAPPEADEEAVLRDAGEMIAPAAPAESPAVNDGETAPES